MAATQHQSTDHIIAPPNEEKLVQPDIIKEQDAAISYSRDGPSHSGAFNVAGDLTVYPPNLCAPLAHTMYYKGFENASGKWDEYSPFINTETLDTAGSPTSQQPPSFYGFGSGASSYDRGYLNSGLNPGHGFGNSSISNIGTDGRGWASLDNGRRRGRGSAPLCSCSGTLDILSEQNRGPRASRPKALLASDNNAPAGSNKSTLSYLKAIDASYSLPDCVSEYSEAKFFIIKSYSEDNVHKSIKYSIWASTSNGNRKLDAAFREAKEKQSAVHIFLFFSVNASGQFCGVAEMMGAVDFDKSVDYWQQDKWSGQFPVKWHIIKDVPNSQFRHIVLENNDNKPVTNSRDTQQVKFEQGIEMLNIFKKYETDTSILDDFEFYEERQKAMQERKARQVAPMGGGTGGNGNGNENKNVVALSNDFIRQMSKSFSEVVRLDENERGGATLDASMSKAITAGDTN